MSDRNQQEVKLDVFCESVLNLVNRMESDTFNIVDARDITQQLLEKLKAWLEFCLSWHIY